MLNIKELEERHLKYKIKSYIPYIIIIVILVAIIIVVSSLYITNNIKKEKTILHKPIERQISKKIQEVKVLLTPSLGFMKRVNTPVEVYSNKKIELEKKQNLKTSKKKKRVIKEEVIVEKVITTPIVQEKKRSIKIKITQDQKDIKDVIKRFKINNNPALSLFVAKKYYQLGDYHKSYNYALITNQLNNNIEASWIIFAKSLMKLDKKEMAINTLKKYIDSSHSPRAKILLDEIQSGKFK